MKKILINTLFVTAMFAGISVMSCKSETAEMDGEATTVISEPTAQIDEEIDNLHVDSIDISTAGIATQ